MRYLDQSWKRIFLAPDGAAGGAGDPAASQGGAKIAEGSVSTNPFAGLDFNDYDPEVAKLLKDGNDKFAALQKGLEEAEKARQQKELETRNFQSRFDQAQAQINKLTGASQQQQVDPKQARIDKIAKTLTAKGVKPEFVQGQAEMMAELLEDFGTEIKAQIGADLQPMASTLITREAQLSWQQATTNDPTGASQIPQVLQKASEQVQALTSQGQQVTPQIVKNLIGMAYFDYIQTPEYQQAQQQQVQQQQPFMSQFPQMGGFKPNGAMPQRPNVIDPNAPKYVLDQATDAALQAVMGKWGDAAKKAPAYRGKK